MGRFEPPKRHSELWVGLVHIRPLSRETYAFAGAYTNIVTWAIDPETFRGKVEAIAATLDLYVEDIEGEEPLAERAARQTLTEEVEDLMVRAESNPDAIIYGSFYTYRFDEA